MAPLAVGRDGRPSAGDLAPGRACRDRTSPSWGLAISAAPSPPSRRGRSQGHPLGCRSPWLGGFRRNNGQVIPGLKHDPRAVEAMLGRESGGRLAAWAGRPRPRVRSHRTARHRLCGCPARLGSSRPTALRHWRRSSALRRRQARGADVKLSRARRAAGTPRHGRIPRRLDRSAGWVDPPAELCPRAGAGSARGRGRDPCTGSGRGARARGCRLAPRHGERASARRQGHRRHERLRPSLPELARAVVPVRSAQAATRPLGANMLATILPQRHVASDTRRLLTSFRISPHGRLVMGGSVLPAVPSIRHCCAISIAQQRSSSAISAPSSGSSAGAAISPSRPTTCRTSTSRRMGSQPASAATAGASLSRRPSGS